MSSAKRIIQEAPIDAGEYPDYIHPDHKRKIAAHRNPAMPDRHSEVLASKAYQGAMRRLARYTGGLPRGQQDMMRLSMQMMQALQTVQQIEAGHEEELEQAAVQVVLSLPEFRSAAQAIEQGELRLVPKLTADIDLEGAQMDAEDMDDKEELQIAQVAQELDIEVQKRRFINMLIQGNAMNKMGAYHLANQVLNRIDPRLMNLYGVLTSVGEFGYWIMPEEMQRQGMGAGEGAGGAARIRVGADGVTEIHAQGITFPILVHELVKGLMEYLSYPEDDDAETRQHAMGQADTLHNEVMDIQLGPAAWQDIVGLIEDQEMIPYVYNYLVRLPTGEFNTTMRTLLAGGARAKTTVDQIIQRIRADHDATEESEASSIVNSLLG